MAPRKPPPPTDEDEFRDEEEADEESDEQVDEDDEDDEDEDEDAADEDDEEPDEEPESTPPAPSLRARRRARSRSHPRGNGGMGRPSTGPLPRHRPAPAQSLDEAPSVREAPVEDAPPTELAPDISTWPGTAEAAKMVGRHTSTIKQWRVQGRIRAIQDPSGCWRHNPDDLTDAMEVPDVTDPGAVLATGMTAIVQQGANANERLLAMTEIATVGLREASNVLSLELKRAYQRISDLEEERVVLLDKANASHVEDLKHDRVLTRMRHKHELDMLGSRETSERITGLLTIVGPIAASIGARLLGNIMGAEALEAKSVGDPSVSTPNPKSQTPNPASSPHPPSTGDRLVPFEARVTDAMARLCAAIRNLDGPAFRGLRAMMPDNVASALDDVIQNQSDSVVGKALATIIQAAQNLSDLQFRTLQPIAPSDIAAVLAELRELLKSQVTES